MKSLLSLLLLIGIKNRALKKAEAEASSTSSESNDAQTFDRVSDDFFRSDFGDFNSYRADLWFSKYSQEIDSMKH